MTPQLKNRFALICIALIFTAPVMMAWWVKDDPSLLGISDTKNYGALFVPAVPVDLNTLTQGSDPQAQVVPGRWAMLHLDIDGVCDAACEDSLHAMKQVHVLLNKDTQRLQRRLIFQGDPNALQDQLAGDEALQVLQWTPAQVEALSTRLQLEVTDGLILLMDPLGNMVLHYPIDFDPYGVQSDLRLLFKASQVG